MCVYVSRHYRVGGIAECVAVRERSVELMVCVRVCFKALHSQWYCIYKGCLLSSCPSIYMRSDTEMHVYVDPYIINVVRLSI